MLLAGFRKLKETLFVTAETVERQKLENELKLEELLNELREDDPPENETDLVTNDRASVSMNDVQWNCTKAEGVITSLNDSGGLISKIHPFDKIIAKNDWKYMKVGNKVTFMLYEGKVRYLEVLESGWDTEDVEPIQEAVMEEKSVGYNTDIRTVVGVIEEVQDEIITVDSGDQKIFIPLGLHKDIKWTFVEGDVLSLECVTQEDESSWNPTVGCYGKILSIKSFKPNRITHEIGRVTAVTPSYAIINEAVYASQDVTKTKLKVSDEYEYEAIDSSCMGGGKSYFYRLTNLIKKVEGDFDRKEVGHNDVQLHDAMFSLRLDLQNPATVSVGVFNNSPEIVHLKSCEVTQNSGFVRVDRNEIDFKLTPNSGKFNIYLKVLPHQVGSFVEELVADFGIFKKSCSLTFQIESNPLMSDGQLRKTDRRNDRNVIPGRRPKDCPRFVEKRIPDYHIPSDFRITDFKMKAALVIDELRNLYPFMFEDLSISNYVDKLRHCLYMEEIAMQIHFARYRIERAHFENKGEFLRLEVEGVAEQRPSITIGDKVYATDPFHTGSKKVIQQGFVHKVEQHGLLTKFHRDFHASHNRRDFKIEFEFSRSTYRRQNYALDCVASLTGLGFDFIFPKARNFIRKPQLEVQLVDGKAMMIDGEEQKWFNNNLNKYQRQAIVNVLRGESRPLPHIIYGPPGTGKTQTVVECIAQIADKIPWARIIVAAPSNSAANLIVERLIASKRFHAGDFVRFVSINAIERKQIPEHLKKYCATVDIGFDSGDGRNIINGEDGFKQNCSKTIIMQYKILISTLGSFGPLMHIKFPPDHFTHVIIDEAGQTVETESLIPISFVSKNKGQVVLAGDPKQLGPVLTSHIAKQFGFEKSFLERLTEHNYYLPIFGPGRNAFDSRYVTKLKKNYRSLPSILGIYNDLFYNGQLEAEVCVKNSPEIELLNSLDEILWNRTTRDKQCGVFFINVSSGRNCRSPESCSWYNNEEAGRIFMFVNKLKAAGVDMKDVGIIAPYALQVKNLRRVISDSMPGTEVKVGTVEEFQGQERQVILLSTVRTDQDLLRSDLTFGLGFLQCPKRMNVAISRARALLVVFGKESILARDDNWRHLIQYSKEKQTYFST